MGRKRGQEVISFLFTYGWAIFVVLILIATLTYFGVLNPQRLLPSKCVLQQGLFCMDHQVTSTGEINLYLANALGTSITIDELRAESPVGISCSKTFPDASLLAPGKEARYKLTNCGDLTLLKGRRVKVELTLVYTDLRSSFKHTVVGRMDTNVE